MPKPNRPSGKSPAKQKAAAAEPVIPENYVDFAEQLMKENCSLITKTKIQNLLRLPVTFTTTRTAAPRSGC